MTSRPKQVDCRYEPAYPEHPECVVFALSSPNLTCHSPRPRCAVEGPHATNQCGEWADYKARHAAGA